MPGVQQHQLTQRGGLIMSNRTFSLPLSDADRAYLKMHSVRQGKSPNAADEVLLAVWNGVDPAPVPAALDAATIDSIRRDAVAAAVAAVEQHRPVRIEIKQGATIRTLPAGHRHPVFADVLASLSVRENVYLVGPAGSGKTTLASQCAEALELPFYSTGAVGMAYQLQGFINAEGRYMETDLYRAYVNGGVFLFDEIDASSAQALLAFNAIAANDLAAFPCGTVKRHPDFVIIAAANTFGNGADAQYVGRAQLDAATLDRFSFIAMDYDERLELAISSNDEWTRHVQAFRRAVRELKIRAVVSPRASIKGGKLLSAGLKWDRVEEMLLIRGLSPLDVEKVRANLPTRKAA
jgi:cobaltochelatase CobS